MSHLIEFKSGRASMAYTGQLPWHGLGKRVADNLTPMEMAKEAGVDWRVRKVKIAMDYDDDGVYEPVDQKDMLLVRESDKKVLSVVSGTWKPTQNEEAFQFFNEFVEAGKMSMETAGSLKGGRMVWALGKTKEVFELDGGDRVEGYLLFSNPHEFGQSITVQFTPIRVVCNNTLTLALESGGKHRVAINHRNGYDEAEVKQTLGIASDVMARYKETAEVLSKARYTDETALEYMQRVFPMTTDEKKKSDFEEGTRYADHKKLSRNAQDALAVVDTQPGAEFAPGTFWNLFNAVTFMTDHVIGRNVDSRLSSAWYGQNRIKKFKAMNLALEMADKA